jgi:methyl-accepting chemotaxis protein
MYRGTTAVKYLNFFARLRIGGRIYFGFLVCLALVGMLGALGVYSFRSIEASHSYYARISKNGLAITRSERDFVALRRNVSLYMLTGQRGEFNLAQDLYTKVHQDMAQIVKGIANPARRVEFQDAAKLVDEYWALFEKAVKMRADREKLLNEKLELAGTRTREGISKVASALMGDENYEAAALAGQAQESFLSALIGVSRYIATNDRNVADSVKGDFDSYRIIFGQTVSRAKGDAAKQAAVETSAADKEFAKVFDELVKLNTDLTTLAVKTMGDLSDKARKAVHEFTDTQTALMANIDEEVSNNASSTSNQMIAVGLSALVLGLALAYLIARSIVRPVKGLTGGMHELADGNFDVVLPGLERRDEIGEIARAVEAFKVKSAQKAKAEAEANADRELKEAAAKAERDRIAAEARAAQEKEAAAARDAATAKVMEEFDAAVGGIAKAAMAGDFTQRVPLDGKQGVIRNLAEAMNAMCDNIGKVMDDLVGMMGALAEGDLTRRIDADYHGAFGTLKNSANATASKLAETVAEITASAREVANAAAEISTSTTDLSQRTEEQAAGLEQTSASMEQIAATVRKNAENAQHANNLTAGAREVADKGGAVVASTVEAMSRIEESSNKIADIITVIDEIARQTNLLALNAAVEAARAGDAGRGFAVVATEVRSLAQRSSQAAKDIKDLITSSSLQVRDGVDLVNRTGTSLGEIVASIKSIADIVADIATASAEQATGLDQVNKALTQMDEVTQQNSALVEENAATAKTLESQSAVMTERVGFFRLAAGAAVQRGSRRRVA